jgi:DNA-binding transcriptional LysR family regulator
MDSENSIQSSLNSLMTFHEVAKHKSFSKAAEELYISQPAVTKHIRNLELKVGMRLIQRGRGGFALTEGGKTLFKYTQKISSHLMEIEDVLGDLQKDYRRFLRIGTTESYSKCLMPKLLSGFQTSFPAIKISLDVGNSEEIEKNLSTYRNDLAVIGVTRVSPKIESIPFLKEELVLIVSPEHPLSKRKSVSLKELEAHPLIIRAKGSTTRKILLQAFKELDIAPSLLVEAGSSEFIKQWVSEGKGVSVIVKRIVEDEGKRGIVRIVPLTEKLYLKVAFLYLKEQRFNPAIKAFVKYMEGRGRRIINT